MSRRACPHCGAALSGDERVASLSAHGARCSRCGKPLPSADTSLAGFEPGVDLELDAFGLDSLADSSVESGFEDPFQPAMPLGAGETQVGDLDGSVFDELEFETDEDPFDLGAIPLGGEPLPREAPTRPVAEPERPRAAAADAGATRARGRSTSESGELDFAHPGRELSDIDEQDLSLLGTYRVRRGADKRTETIWDPSSRGQASRPDRPQRPKPLGPDRAEAKGAERPPAADPFGGDLGDYDPFADLPGDGGATALDDPFAELDRGPAGVRPADPEVVEDDDDPFDSEDAFSNAEFDLGPPSTARSRSELPPEPVFDEGRPSKDGANPRAREGRGAAGSNRGEREETFFIEQPSLGQAGDAAHPSHTDALEFEDLSIGSGAEDAAASRFARARPRAAASTGRRGRGRGKRTRRRSSGRLAVALALLAVVGGGAALTFTEYGPFGLDYFQAGPARVAPPPAAPGALQPLPTREVRSDTAAGYRAEIAALERDVRANRDPKVRRALLALYLEFAARFPGEFERDRSLDARVADLTAELGDASSPRVRALALMREGKSEEARVALDQALAMAAEDPNLLCLHGDIALQQSDLKLAKQYFERALELDPQLVRAEYFLGLVAERADEPEEARRRYDKVLQLEASHLASRLGKARLALSAGQLEVAAREAEAVIGVPADATSLQERFEAHRLLAQTAARGRHPERLEEHLSKAAALRPHDEETALELAHHYRQRGDVKQAERVLETCMAQGCDSPRAYEALAKLKLDSQPAEASRLAEEAVDKHAKDPAAHYLRAEIARKRGQSQAARELYGVLASEWPEFVEGHRRLADLELEEGNLSRAEAALERGLAVAPQALMLLERLALVHEAGGQLVKAADAYRRLVEREPKNTDVRRRYALVLDELGRSSEAVRQFEALNAQGFGDPDTTRAYARALARSGNPRAGIAELERLVRRDPQNVEAYTALGELYTEQGSLESAQAELESALRIRSGHAPALVALGRLEEARGQLGLAARHLQRAIEIDPADDDSRVHLARVYHALGDADSRRSARMHLDAVIQRKDRDRERPGPGADVFALRARTHLALGDYRDALADVVRAIELEPSRVDLLALRGETLYRLKRASDARKVFEDVLTRDSQHASAHYHLGQMALARGDRAAAERHLTAAVRGQEPEFADAHKTLGFMFKERGQAAQARAQFQRFLDAAPSNATRAADREEVERALARLR